MICKLNKYKERSTRRRKWKKKEVEKEGKQEMAGTRGEKASPEKGLRMPEILINLTVTINLQIYAVQSSLKFIKIQNQKVLYTYTYA
jgi:hypothetical protein